MQEVSVVHCGKFMNIHGESDKGRCSTGPCTFRRTGWECEAWPLGSWQKHALLLVEEDLVK